MSFKSRPIRLKIVSTIGEWREIYLIIYRELSVTGGRLGETGGVRGEHRIGLRLFVTSKSGFVLESRCA